MTWNDPPTITTTSTINRTSGTYDWDKYLVDNLRHVANKASCRVTGASDQTGAGATLTTSTTVEVDVGWATEEVDTAGGWPKAATNSTKYEVPTGEGGIYLLSASITFDGGSDQGRRVIRIYKNATKVAERTSIPYSSLSKETLSLATIQALDATDTVHVAVVQSSSRDLDVLGYDEDDTDLAGHFTLIRLGETGAHTDDYAGAGWDTATYNNTDDWWNADVVGMKQLFKPPSCRVYDNTGVSIADSTWTGISFDSESWDTDSMGDQTNSTTQKSLTATTPGVYLFTANVNVGSGGTADGSVRIRPVINGSAVGIREDIRRDTGNTATISLTYLWVATASDTIGVEVYQDSGTSYTTNTGVGNTYMAAIKIASVQQVAGSQRMWQGWTPDPALFLAHADMTYVPANWATILGRDYAGLLYAPPLVILRSKGRQSLTSGDGWKPVKWGKVAQDPWDFVQQERNFGETLVIPVEGQWIIVVNSAFITDFQEAKFTADATEEIITSTGLNVANGEIVRVSSDTTLPGGLAANTNYYVARLDEDHYHLFEYSTNGLNDLNQWIIDKGAITGYTYYINITSAGTGQHTVKVQQQQGQRGIRIVHNASPHAGQRNSVPASAPGETHNLQGLSIVDVVTANEGDEITVEAYSVRDTDVAIGAQTPRSRWAAIWCAPFEYSTAVQITDQIAYRGI